MWKNRLAYGLVLLTAAVLLFLYSKSFLLTVLIVLLLLMVINGMLVLHDAHSIRVSMRVRPGGQQSKDVNLNITVNSDKKLLTAGQYTACASCWKRRSTAASRSRCMRSARYGAFWSTSSRRTRIQASKRALSCTTLAFCTRGLPVHKKHSLRIKSIFNLIKADGGAKKPLPSAFVILRKFRRIDCENRWFYKKSRRIFDDVVYWC